MAVVGLVRYCWIDAPLDLDLFEFLCFLYCSFKLQFTIGFRDHVVLSRLRSVHEKYLNAKIAVSSDFMAVFVFIECLFFCVLLASYHDTDQTETRIDLS